MPGQIIATTEALNTFLHSITEKVPLHYSECTFALQLMLYTGCRAMEAVELQRWTVRANDVVLLATLKNNNPRSFLQDELPPEFNFWVSNLARYKQHVTYRRLQYVFKKLIGPYGISTGEKAGLLHLYRYNYIKWLFAAGMHPEQIQTLIGHNNLASTMFYIDAQIVSEHNLIVS